MSLDENEDNGNNISGDDSSMMMMNHNVDTNHGSSSNNTNNLNQDNNNAAASTSLIFNGSTNGVTMMSNNNSQLPADLNTYSQNLNDDDADSLHGESEVSDADYDGDTDSLRQVSRETSYASQDLSFNDGFSAQQNTLGKTRA